jgi:hypothetical protein
MRKSIAGYDAMQFLKFTPIEAVRYAVELIAGS